MGLLSDFLLVSEEVDDAHLVDHPEACVARVESRRIDPIQLAHIVGIVLGIEARSPIP